MQKRVSVDYDSTMKPDVEVTAAGGHGLVPAHPNGVIAKVNVSFENTDKREAGNAGDLPQGSRNPDRGKRIVVALGLARVADLGWSS